MKRLSKIKEFVINKLVKLPKKMRFEYFYNKGVDYFAKKEYSKAMEQFKLSIDTHNVKPQGYYNLGLAYQSLKEYEKAIVNYQKFLELVPEDHDGLYNLALANYSLANYDKAIELFKTALDVKKEKESIQGVILAYLGKNDLKSAIEFSENLFKEDGGLEFYYYAAKVFENKNSMNKDFTYLDLALEMYSAIVKKDPDFFEAYLAISICYAKKGEWQKSVMFCQNALDVNPKSYEANNQMGLVNYCCDEVKEAVKYYEVAVKLKPEGDYKVYSNLGYAYEKVGEKSKAIKMFTRLVNKFPNCPAREEIKNHLRVLKNL